MQKIIWYAIGVILCITVIVLYTGCKSTETAGIESMVEIRLANERERIRAEFARELSNWITEDIERINESIERQRDRETAFRTALEEYRAGYLRVLDRLAEVESGSESKK